MIKPILFLKTLFLIIIFIFTNIDNSKAEVSFLAMADSPYTNKAFYLIENELENVPQNTNFIIHLGDIKPKEKNCTEKDYKDFRDLLKQSPIPVFIIPGTNGYSVCGDHSQAKQFWDQYILKFEKNWKLKFLVNRQKEQKENFSFLLENTLFIGINLFEKKNPEKNSYKNILKNNITWLQKNLKQHQDQVKNLVIFAHDFIGLKNKNYSNKSCGNIILKSWKAHKSNDYFRNHFYSLVKEFKKPILYINGNDHCWTHDRPYKGITFFERIVIDKIEKLPMVKFTIKDNKFRLDQRIKDRENILIKKATLGDVWSQYFLSSEYFNLNELQKAKKWLAKAANQEFPPAKALLGKILQGFLNKTSGGNYDQANFLLQSSIKKQGAEIDNFLIGKNNLPYQKRINQLKRKIIKASKYEAHFDLGLMYFRGLGQKQNYKEALKHYKKASQGVGNAYFNIAMFHFYGLGIAKNSNEAIKWCTKGAVHGVTACMFFIGKLYLDGLEVKKDYKKAAKWFKSAGNHAQSLLHLGFLYFNGLGVPQDNKIAMNYFKNSARNGSQEAKKILDIIKNNK